ncbi:MAG: hypothetical protein OH319_04000 [Candidatus Parvarchaeota archaeon]|nr:hypothetical protein [Candidatus Jingweiarchaeum tengchongense]MCW1298051.1 hypothetical protein [Candidatus Jingweiarchaeum tengchongense]MCW1300149.1 hypothetical protein [Candidatus Jingweiarchaeum tengchongense]MCW1305921.1 hypothetical protein [Candidatus Jingweiarchaeum tengchongense]MCW1310911.1 hypothetical protein [Candidatus Jingweiarchaeum tengchongense]
MSLKALNLIKKLIFESAKENNFHLTVDFERYLLEFFRSRFSLIGSVNFCDDLEKKLKEIKKDQPEILKRMVKEAMELYQRRTPLIIVKKKKKRAKEAVEII